ncbi:plakophilin-2 [Salminus brasiliensis]|uniref:plakophilin-2 n=1 Tax=Salminus brasiliensis TaxID=930266 RepID=UPI003B831E1C
MAADESLYVRTVLSLHGSVKPDDTSLALPSEDRLARSDSHTVTHRRCRVEQQVQLTLSRKGKRPTLTGSQSSSQLSATTPVGNGSVKVSSCASIRPARRVDVSHWASPEFPQVNGSYGTYRFGPAGNSFHWGTAAFTLPAMRSVQSADRLQATISPRHCARSETLRNGRTFAMSRAATLQLPSKAIYDDDPLDDVFLPDGPHVTPLRSEHHQVFLERQKVQRSLSQPGEQLFGSQDLTWLVARGGWEGQGTASRRPSQTASLVNAEVHTNGTAVAEEHVVKQEARVKSVRRGKQAPEMTLKKAVKLLPGGNSEMQVTAAKFIQNQCYSSADAKKTMLHLRGIPQLLKLLDSENEELQQTAAGALRNVVFENSENKMEVKDCCGVAVILRQLSMNRDTEMRRQLTGLLWNLSSHDMLKEHLSRDVVKPLTDSVLVPCSGISEGEDPKLELLADAEVFLNATACLRNISSVGPNGRKAMRDCEGLIDSLVYYVRGTIADYKPDDKALENCVCILHNLTYQFELELPETLRPVLQESRQSLALETHTPGCFSVKSSKIAETDNHSESDCPLLEEKGNPHGVEWLWSAITIRMYLSLVAISNRQLTQEASIGAMQNLTAGSGGVSQAVAHIIVLRESGLQQVKKMLQEGEDGVKRVSVCLLKNLSRYKELHPDIIEQVLPELVAILPTSDTNTEQPVEITSVCHILNNLSQASVQNSRTILNHGVLPRVIKISRKDHRYGSTRAGQAAGVLLQTLWKHSELHGSYKKAGYRKTDFINSRTAKAVSCARD